MKLTLAGLKRNCASLAVRLAVSSVGPGVGDWVARKLGWRRFVNDRFQHPHAPDCAAKSVRTELRPGGMITRCDDCGITIDIKLAVWEAEPGRLPEHVAQWFLEELAKSGALKGA